MKKMLKYHKKTRWNITCRKCRKTTHTQNWGSEMSKAGKETLECPYCGNVGPIRKTTRVKKKECKF
jgi:hypothetical protein